MSAAPRLGGCLPVLCTPFHDDLSVDLEGFEAVIDFALACGVDGVVYPGTASEVGHLSAEERSALVARLGARLEGRVPFVVGASAPTPEAASDFVAEGAAVGAAAAMVMAPAALGDDLPAQRDFFHRIDAGLPLMLQNAPAPFGAGLAPGDVAALARALPSVAYVKEETLPCGANLQTVLDESDGAIGGVFGGAGGRYVTDELARGALGTVPAVEIADLHVTLIRAWDADDHAEARRLFAAALPMLNMQAVFRTRLTKEVLRRRGLPIGTASRHPDPVPDATDLAELTHWLDHLAADLTQPLRTAAE